MKKTELDITSIRCQEALLALRDSIDIWGGKWKLFILLYLSVRVNEKNRFKEMQKALFGISAKILSKELKDLETNKLVSRAVQNTRPVTVEYSLTEYGKSFLPIAENLLKWGLEHRQVIMSE